MEYLINVDCCRRSTYELFRQYVWDHFQAGSRNLVSGPVYLQFFFQILLQYICIEKLSHYQINKYKFLHSRSCHTLPHHNSTTTMFYDRLDIFQMSFCMAYPSYQISPFVHKYHDYRNIKFKNMMFMNEERILV